MNERPSISPILDALRQERTDEERFIIACAINLYIESLRTISGRLLLRHYDIEPLFRMIGELTNPLAEVDPPPARSRALSDEEKKTILDVTGTVERRL